MIYCVKTQKSYHAESVKTQVVELNKLGRGQAEIRACGGSEFQRAPACVQPIALSEY